MKIRKIAISNNDGDAPGINAIIRAVTISALKRGWEVYGILDGFRGILSTNQSPNKGFILLTDKQVNDITGQGGTILGGSNGNNLLEYYSINLDRSKREFNPITEIVKWFRANRIDALIMVGGTDALAFANALSKKGVRLIFIPKTINNNLSVTDTSLGFDTAVEFATQSLDRLHSTASALCQVIVVEVMGRFSGWIALHSGVTGSADVILLPEHPYDIYKVAEKIQNCEENGSKYTVVVVAEGAYPVNSEFTVVKNRNGYSKLFGGIGEIVAEEIRTISRKEVCVVNLGHLLRGGTPTSFDRLLGSRFGVAAVWGIEQGMSSVMVSFENSELKYVQIGKVLRNQKLVSMDSDIVLAAKDLDISFG